MIDVEAADDKYFHASWQEKHRSMTLKKYLKRRKAGENLYWAQSALPQPLVADVIEPEWAKWQDPWALLVWHGPGGQVTKAHSVSEAHNKHPPLIDDVGWGVDFLRQSRTDRLLVLACRTSTIT